MLSMKFQRRRLSAVFVSAVVFVSLTAARAFAAGVHFDEPSKEKLGTAQLKSQNTIGEARIPNHLLRAWEADDTTRNVWMALDGGSAFQVDPGTTRTFFSPTVATLGSQFMVLHTGDDGGIYYTLPFISPNPHWKQIPPVVGAPSDGPIDAVELGPGSGRILVVYHVGDINGDLLYTIYNGASWTPFKEIGGGTGLSSPSIAWNQATGKVVAVLQGEDSRLWKSTYNPNNDTWDFWTSEGETTQGRPTIAVNQAGTMMIGRPLDGGDRELTGAAFDSSFNKIANWDSDSPLSHTEARLVSDGTNFFLTYTNPDHTAQFVKLIFD